MQGIPIINGTVPEAVSGKVRQQQILVGDLDPIRIHLSFIDVVSGDRRHQIEHISSIHFINRIILAVPKFDTGVCQYQRSAGSSVIVCRYRKQHRRQAGHDHQDCQQDTDDSCTQVSCLFCLHKKLLSLRERCTQSVLHSFVQTLCGVSSDFLHGKTGSLCRFAQWQQHRQKRYTYHTFYGNFH